MILEKYEERFFPLFQLLPDPRPHTPDLVRTKNLDAKRRNEELLFSRSSQGRLFALQLNHCNS